MIFISCSGGISLGCLHGESNKGKQTETLTITLTITPAFFDGE